MKSQVGPHLEGSANFRGDVQGLRALAVILVILAHADVPHFSGGYVGVDVFFVISGFVITQVLVGTRESPLREQLLNFYGRRIRRIIPASTVVLVTTVIATYTWLGPSAGKSLLTDVQWASLFAANWHFIVTSSGYFIPGVPPSLVTQFWSLAVEEQFYIFYPLVIFSTAILLGVRRRKAILLVILFIMIAISSWYSIHETPLNGTLAYYSPFTRFWELALGGLLVVLPRFWQKQTPRFNTLLGVVALCVIFASAMRLNDYSVYPGSLAWWPCGATAILLWTGKFSPKGGPSSLLSWRPVRYVGDISYGLYLWHYPWLMLPERFVTHPLSAFTRIELVLGAFGCAILSYHFLENPIRRSRWMDERRWRPGLLLIGSLIITWSVTLLYQFL